MTNKNQDHQKILSGCHHDPFCLLGVHPSKDEKSLTFRTHQPYAETIFLLLGGKKHQMFCEADAIFTITLPYERAIDHPLSPFHYQYTIKYIDGCEQTINDPYGFLPLISQDDLYLYNAGRNYQIYEHFGAHLIMAEGINGIVFRVWAPNAKAISVVGNFNGWNHLVHQMRNLGESGVWELFIPQLGEYEYYKFSILDQQDTRINKCDPYQFFGETRPQTSSIVRNINNYSWNDQEWVKSRSQDHHKKPISIYEIHLGSWLKDPEHPTRFLDYKDLTSKVIAYAHKMGFTHIELMPIMEHPLDESWGYQVTAPFSVTSRYGTPEDFMYFVDQCHQENIGVILDWVPAHFPKDAHSLGRFDGTPLYEHGDERLGAHPEWGTYIYNYGRNEVSNYLIANALFWLDKYHIDGLRVDAVASMLYLDYARKDGEWVANRYGGNQNLDAIEFIKHANSIIYDRHPNSLVIAEESTSFYGVSKQVSDGGLGFGFKWNMGWMNDMLSYFKTDPLFRKFHHDSLTFSIMYAFSENFILPLSHDEVVHGKKSLLEKMPGDFWQQMANLRLLFFYMWTHPGKKLLFMGDEFGQRSEWNCKTSLDWHLLDIPEHKRLSGYLSKLNHFYRSQEALWECDGDATGFSWLDIKDRDQSIISFVRFATDPQNHLVCICNFTPEPHSNYTINMPSPHQYKEIFNSDDLAHGGSGKHNNEIIDTFYDENNILKATITIPPLGGIILQPHNPQQFLTEKRNSMSNSIVSADGKIKNALALLVELKEQNPETPLNKLLQKVVMQFDLSPKDSEVLNHHFSQTKI